MRRGEDECVRQKKEIKTMHHSPPTPGHEPGETEGPEACYLL